ncbi:hypothetical protein FPOAC2_13407 [Fusarium poae]|jgi:hypothetical protein
MLLLPVLKSLYAAKGMTSHSFYGLLRGICCMLVALWAIDAASVQGGKQEDSCTSGPEENNCCLDAVRHQSRRLWQDTHLDVNIWFGPGWYGLLADLAGTSPIHP